MNRLAAVGRGLVSRLTGRTWAALASLSIWQVANYLIPLLTFPYLARVLGVEAFGYLGLALAVNVFAVVVIDWGFVYSSARAVAQNRDSPDTISRIIWETVAARLLLAVPVIGVIAVGVTGLVVQPILQLTILASLIGLVGSVLSLEWALRGSEAFRSFTVSSVAGRLAIVPLIYILVTREEHVWIAAALTGTGTLFVAILTIVAAGRQGLLGSPMLSWRGIWLRLREGGTMFAAELLKNVYASGLLFVLALTSGNYQAGLYSGADRTRWPFVSLLNPVVMVAYPKMSTLARKGGDEAARTALSLVGVQAVVGLAIAAGLAVTAPLVVAILLGDAFAAAVPVLQVLAAAIPFVALNGALGMLIMLPYGLNREYMFCVGWGALAAVICGPVLCIALAAFGASIALVVSEAVTLTAMWFVLHRRFPWFRLNGPGR